MNTIVNQQQLIEELQREVEELNKLLDRKEQAIVDLYQDGQALKLERDQLAAQNDEWKNALKRISAWDELDCETRINIGSNGQRDHYRSIAERALNKYPAASLAEHDARVIEVAMEIVKSDIMVAWRDGPAHSRNLMLRGAQAMVDKVKQEAALRQQQESGNE